jgi:hypothetical protein
MKYGIIGDEKLEATRRVAEMIDNTDALKRATSDNILFATVERVRD